MKQMIRKGCFGLLPVVLLLLCLCPFSVYAAIDMEAVRTAGEAGQRVFDEAGLFDDDTEEGLNRRAIETAKACGFDVIVFTTDDSEGFTDAGDLADYLYVEGGFGTGEDASGTLFLIDMESSSYYLYTKGEAARYLTDSALGYIDEYDVYPALAEGSFAMAADAFLTDVEGFYETGIQDDQYNYNTETGERDYASAKGNPFQIWKVIVSVLLGAVLGWIPCSKIRKSYAMEAEKWSAKGFALAYRAEASFQFAAGASEKKLINQFVTSVPIPRSNPKPPGGGHSGGSFRGSSFGGGRSIMSAGRGGSHGGRGGRF